MQHPAVRPSERRLQTHSSCPTDPLFLFTRVEDYYCDRLERAWRGDHPLKGEIPGSDSIQMRSNDYLCVAGDSRVIDAEIAALRAAGHGEAVSRVWQHHIDDPLNMFEQRVASLMGAEAAVLASSGYCANVGLLQCIVTADTPVYIDMKAHLSLWEGIKAARANALGFPHNDVERLRRLVARHGPGLIAVDSVYSIDGDICPLAEIVEIAEAFGCAIVLDETHSFGAWGARGAGFASMLGLADRIHFRTAGLSKAVASRGGIVVCSRRNAEFLRYTSLPVIFSTQVLAHEVAGYNAVLDIFSEEPWRRANLHANHRYLRSALDELGYNVDASHSQIIALEAGDILAVVRLRKALERRGVFGAVFFPPATPEKRCLIRFTVNCSLTRQQLDRVIEVCAEIREEVRLDEWPSTRRKGRRGTKPPASSPPAWPGAEPTGLAVSAQATC